jgi:FAD/FMN-containing dehydrogenase
MTLETHNLIASNSGLIDQLIAIVGEPHLLLDDESRSLYAQDIFTRNRSSLAVVQPADTDELAAAVKASTDAGCDVIPRGGGMSYTSGYVPVNDNAITIDLSRMNRILEINTDDMYVTAEAGCTWKQLYEALVDTGYRTPYWGTLSGTYSTIGGGFSQNSIFWGSGQYGSAADNVIGFEVVLADGSVLRTGSSAQKNTQPFFRHFGPDLTGIFTCDAGTLGFKATATIRLIKQFEGKAFCAYDFKRSEDTIAAMSEISRQGLAMECFGFDPFLQSQRLKRESLGKDVKALAGVMKASGSVLGALKDGAKVALAGRRYMHDVDYSVQLMIEDYTQAGADAKAKKVAEIAAKFSGREISNSIPKIARANPFGPVNVILGPEGERWVCSHVLVPHSKAEASHHAILDLFTKYESDFNHHKIETGFLFAIISSNAFVLEPVFFWPDAPTEIHAKYIEPDHFKKLPKCHEDLAARELVAKVRHEFAAMFRDLGGVHMQIGKDYHYADGIEPESLALVKAIKASVDPDCRINPGALGIGV